MLIASSLFALGLSQSPLQSLTVPRERLPRDCRLLPVPRPKSGQPQIVGYPNLTENPWVGTDREKLRSIRQVIDGPPHAQGPDEWSRLSDNVIEGYRAIYIGAATDRVEVNVYAVRFTDSKFAAKALLTKLVGDRVIARGSTVVRVIARGNGECVKRITEYVTSLKQLG